MNKQKLWALLAVVAGLVLVTTAAFGLSPVELIADLGLNVEWLEGFTGHTDGISMTSLAEGTVAAAAGRQAATGSEGTPDDDATPVPPTAEGRQALIALSDAQFERFFNAPKKNRCARPTVSAAF